MDQNKKQQQYEELMNAGIEFLRKLKKSKTTEPERCSPIRDAEGSAEEAVLIITMTAKNYKTPSEAMEYINERIRD